MAEKNMGLPLQDFIYILGGSNPDPSGKSSHREFPILWQEEQESEAAHLQRVSRAVNSVMAAGGLFLLVPRERASWLTDHPTLIEYFIKHHEVAEISGETGIVFKLLSQTTEDPVPSESTIDYISVLQQLHNIIQPAIYSEIGVYRGASLHISQACSVAIDPDYSISGEVLENKTWIKLYRMESDYFFEHHSKDRVLEGGALSLSFIDGLHLFDQVLRDFYHLEQWSSPNGVIVIHDVLPPSVVSAQRERVGIDWVGDVWRIVPCLQKYRPDLRLRVINASPSGLLIVSQLDPKSNFLKDREGMISAEFLGQPAPYEDRVKEYLRTVPVISLQKWIREAQSVLL